MHGLNFEFKVLHKRNFASVSAEDIVNVIVDCAAVPSLVRHLQAPPPLREGDTDPMPYEHEVEKASAFTLGLLAIKVIALPESSCFFMFSWFFFIHN